MIEKLNRLGSEVSPYLLQHAGNPVDWFPWCSEAFEIAEREDKPVFLSIGYSTCHWCHVMERESFEDEETARIINKTFVPVKVDREERPDIDNVYMTACRLMTGGGGGWPLTIIMTPDKKPFFAATYIPRDGSGGMMGLRDLVGKVVELWKYQREKIADTAGKVVSAINEMSVPAEGASVDKTFFDAAYGELLSTYDTEKGGFGSAPKFPTPHRISFLLAYSKKTALSKASDMAAHTLRAMRRGGIFDQVGLGFHRYSVDASWLLPHFEKMLYDQALLADAYLDALEASGDREFSRTAKEIFKYVLADMTSPEGGFYTAEDADSEGEEGRFYLWSETEIKEAMGEDSGEGIRLFNIKQEGNFIDPFAKKQNRLNILHLSPAYSMTDHAEAESLEKIRTRLYQVREKRIRPMRDDKILTDCSGLMIAAMARGSGILDAPELLSAAKKAADFILSFMSDEGGRLLHRYAGGRSGIGGFADDYAFFIHGLLALYEATAESRYLDEASRLNQDFIALFWDDASGGFFLTASDAEKLLFRSREFYDGATPSANSVAVLNLLRLNRHTGNEDLKQRADRLIGSFSAYVEAAPSGCCFFLSALLGEEQG